MQFSMGFNHFPDADAVYLKLLDAEYGSGGPASSDDGWHIDLDKDGNVLGITFLNVSDGVDVDGIPEGVLPTVNRLLEEHRIRINEPA